MNSITLRIAGVPEHFNLPWHLGLERRAFVRAGIDLKWRTVAEGTGAMCKLLRSGEIDLAILVTEGAVRDILHGNPARIIATYVDTPLTWGVHVGAGAAITEPEQLRNVPFAISRPNSGSHLAAMAYAMAQGWNLSEEDLVVVNDLPGAVEALQGPSPLAFLWEKYTTKPLVDSGALRRVDEHRSSWPSFVIVASEAVLAEHPEPVKRLLKVIRDQALGLMSKKTAPEIIAKRYKMGLEDVRAWFGEVRWNTNGRLEDHALTAVAATLRQAGMLDGDLTEEVLCQKLLWPPQKS
ncbi:MAG: ABC transporter substrate-binding protein [Flavobacteriales bacterium]|nr:ABC transporter substrate-binding protein [Flavobacteriales bacterium]